MNFAKPQADGSGEILPVRVEADWLAVEPRVAQHQFTRPSLFISQGTDDDSTVQIERDRLELQIIAWQPWERVLQKLGVVSAIVN